MRTVAAILTAMLFLGTASVAQDGVSGGVMEETRTAVKAIQDTIAKLPQPPNYGDTLGSILTKLGSIDQKLGAMTPAKRAPVQFTAGDATCNSPDSKTCEALARDLCAEMGYTKWSASQTSGHRLQSYRCWE